MHQLWTNFGCSQWLCDIRQSQPPYLTNVNDKSMEDKEGDWEVFWCYDGWHAYRERWRIARALMQMVQCMMARYSSEVHTAGFRKSFLTGRNYVYLTPPSRYIHRWKMKNCGSVALPSCSVGSIAGAVLVVIRGGACRGVFCGSSGGKCKGADSYNRSRHSKGH